MSEKTFSVRIPHEQVDEKSEEKDEESAAGVEPCATPDEVAPIDYPGPFRLILLLAGVMLAVFVVALDTTIVSTAIPRITDEFHSVADEAWYGTAFFMTIAAFQSAFGKAYKFFSIKWIYLPSLLIFEIGSLLCAVAPSSPVLIIGRAIAGVGGAGVASGSYLILGLSAPPHRVPILLGSLGAAFAMASVIGPLLGGVLTQHLSWRWCFYINLPIGAITAIVILIFFRTPKHAKPARSPTREKILQMDLPGIAILLAALICLSLSLQWGGVSKPWHSGSVIATLICAFVLFGLFGFVETRLGERAAVNIRILRQNRTIASFMVFQVFLNGCFFLFLYFLPLYYQGVAGLSPAQSGIRMIPLLAIMSGGAIVVGAVYMLTGEYQLPTIFGCALVVAANALIYTLDARTPSANVVGYQVLAGIGIGFTAQAAITVSQVVVADRADLSSVTAMALFFQLFGGALWLPVAQSLFINRVVRDLSAALGFDAGPLVASAGAGGAFSAHLPASVAAKVIDAFVNGLQQVYILGMVLAGVALTIAVLSVVFDRRKLPRGTMMSMGA